MTDQASEGLHPSDALREAVHRFRAASVDGIRERIFTFAFRGLVYPQIWEDPEVDLKALQLRPGSRLVAIASGGCNVMSYLTADPASILAVDLNRAHVALTRLKLAAIRQLPSYELFFRFVGEADCRANMKAYRRFLRFAIDPETRRYWEGRGFFGRRRITLFKRRIYRHGLLGRFIGLAHLVARLYGVNPRRMLRATSIHEQRRLYEMLIAPLFEKRLVRWALSSKVSLYGLGIPPAQFEALAGASGDMAAVLKARLARLACAFPLKDNYFAWQAFDRSYGSAKTGPLPPYLRPQNFDEIRARAGRVDVVRSSITDALKREKIASVDAFLLLDAQDWMTDAQLDALWSAITRAARLGARVVFRTAAEQSPLPGRISGTTLSRWTYEADRSKALGDEDRSSIYGGFHIYRLIG